MPIEPGNLSLGVLAGGLIGTVIGHFLTKDRNAGEGFNKAAAEFMCAFTTEIRLIEESTTETDFIEIFNSGCVKHYNALIRFQAYLSESDRVEIKKAWDNHCYPQGLDEYERMLRSAKFLHYDHSQGVEIIDGKPKISEEHSESLQREKKLVTKNLDSILAFARFR